MAPHIFTDAEKSFITSFAKGRTYKEITEGFNDFFGLDLKQSQVVGWMKNNKITTGKPNRYKQGCTSYNKGAKGLKIPGSEKGWFKPGHVPKNHKPVGTESMRNNYKTGQKHIYVKVAEPNVWRMKHVLEWEKHNGPVPKGKVIIFLDGNHINCDIGNLQMIDKATNARLNQNHLRYNDPEITKTGIAIAEVIAKVGEIERREVDASK